MKTTNNKPTSSPRILEMLIRAGADALRGKAIADIEREFFRSMADDAKRYNQARAEQSTHEAH